MKKLLLISLAFLLLATTKKVDAQTPTTITTSYTATANQNYGVVFNIRNNNRYPISVTDISSYFAGSTTINFKVLYNSTPVNDVGGTWTQPNVDVGANGWVLGWSSSIFVTGATVNSLTTVAGNTMSIRIPAYSTYGIALIGDVNDLGYCAITAGSGTNYTTVAGVSIVTADDVGYSLGALPSPGASYPRCLVGGIKFIPIIPPTPPLAGLAYDITTDTAWLNSPFTFVNNSNTYDASFWDVVSYSPTYNGTYTPYTPPSPRLCVASWNTCYIDTLNQNFTWAFNEVGYYKLKLKVINLHGVDSLTKIVVCAPPSQKPSVSFFSVNRSVGFTDQLNYYDLSQNGPTAWKWYLNPTYYGNNTFAGYPIANSFYTPSGHLADTTTQNPYLYAFDGGVFDVCLAAGNSLGWDTLCRHNYLTVNNGYMMCNGADSVSYLSSGYVYDQGGPTSKYTGANTGNCPAGFRIAACADTVILDIERFKLAPGDSIVIRIGSPFGKKIKMLSGATLADSLRHFRIPGGSVFLQMYSSLTSPGDSGFAIRWSTVPPSYSKPTASFTMTTNGPTQRTVPSVYIGYTSRYTSTSTGLNMSYSWDTNGDGVYGSSAGGDSIFATAGWTANKLGLFNICLKAYNCVGTDSVCKQLRVLPIPSKPTADMTVNKTSGFTTDTFRFYDASINGAMTWQWSFSPTTVTYLSGTNSTSENPIVFLNSVQCYTVTLKASNSLGSNTKVISCMVNVAGYNSPGSKAVIPSQGSDIGISRVTLGTIDTTTALQTPVYTQMNDRQIATLYKGVDYTVTTYRLTNTDPMTTKVWLDFNMNASFTEANETIIDEKSQYKIATSKTFRIPDNNPTGNTRMRVGITYDSTSITPDRADLGCYEDYGIIVGIDYVNPVLALKGPSVYKMQVGTHYTENGVTATDNLEGDISTRYIRTGFLDTNTLGYYTLTYTVADLYGNISLPVKRIVQVEINETGPTITLIGSDTVSVGVYYNYTEQGATAVDNNGKNISNSIMISGNVNTNILGNYPVTYSVTDAFGFTDSKIRTVMVVDTTKPVIETKNVRKGNGTADTIRWQIGTQFSYQGLIWATDNYDTNNPLTQAGQINVNLKGYYTLLFNATDASGNQANPFRLVVSIDNTIYPTISLIGDGDMIVDVNTTYTEPGGGLGVTYSSEYYSLSTLVLSVTSNLDMTKIGNYAITYCVSDPSQNTTCVTRTIHVVDRKAPIITLRGEDPYTLARYQPYVDPGATIFDNYNTEAQLKPFLKIDSLIVRNDVPGLYYVTYDVKDIAGNVADQVIRTVRVVDMFLGINSVSASDKVKIYPNPSNGKFTVDLEKGTSIQSIKIYSIIGSLVREISVKANTITTEIDMTDVNEGIYIVKVEGDGSSFTQKINIVK